MTNENVGDYLLVEASKYLLRAHDPDTVLVDIDVDPRNDERPLGNAAPELPSGRGHEGVPAPDPVGSPRTRVSPTTTTTCTGRPSSAGTSRTRIKDLDAIVFTGGGFIKYKTQGLNYIDELILKTARRRDIPVMMNAVGVEGYSETDIRCQRLKKALNSDNVRVITTRDDIDTLNDHYITNAEHRHRARRRSGVLAGRHGDRRRERRTAG